VIRGPKGGGRSRAQQEPDSNLRSWVAATLGPTRGWTRLGAAWDVFAMTTADGRERVVKQLGSARAFEQEQQALDGWFLHAGEVGGARVPRLIASEPCLAALILERLPGSAPPEGDAVVHHAAGRFLAALHRLEIRDDDRLPLGDALAQRTRAWRRRVELEPEWHRVVDEHGPRPELFEGVSRVPCHRDFEARNWLWDGDTLAVVDFEHARMDCGLVDLAKLTVGSWRARPDLRTAFFAGYGREPTEVERERMRCVLVLHGLASLAWGREHGHETHVREGREALAAAAGGEVWATPRGPESLP
jgi:hypothetical protein